MLYFIVLFIAFIFSFVFTIPTISLARKLKLVTDKKKRYHPAHTHTGVVPRGGGIPVYLGLLIAVILFVPLNKLIIGVLVAAFLLVLVGTLDDYFDISPYFRFLINLAISALAIGFGLGIPYISNPFGGVIQLDQWKITFDFSP